MGVLGCRDVGVCAVLFYELCGWMSLEMHGTVMCMYEYHFFFYFPFSVYSTTASVPPLDAIPTTVLAVYHLDFADVVFIVTPVVARFSTYAANSHSPFNYKEISDNRQLKGADGNQILIPTATPIRYKQQMR